jgi:hypothetical protein
VTKIIGGDFHSLFPLIKDKKSLSLSFPNIIREDAHYQWRREGGLAGAPAPAKKCPSLVNI